MDNPVKTQSTLNQLVDCLVYDRLFEVDENFNVTSRILSDWYYSKNEDSAGVWVLKVREGIQMHDGSTLTAQDVAYSVSCIFTSERHKHLQQQVGRVYSSAYNGEVYLAVEGADNAQLPQRMSIPVIKSGSVGDEIPVGSGPYMYNEARTALVKFDGYENSESLPLDEVQLRAYRGTLTEPGKESPYRSRYRPRTFRKSPPPAQARCSRENAVRPRPAAYVPAPPRSKRGIAVEFVCPSEFLLSMIRRKAILRVT